MGNEDCTEMHNTRGDWQDKNCFSKKNAFVCAIRGDQFEAAREALAESFPGFNLNLYSFHIDPKKNYA